MLSDRVYLSSAEARVEEIKGGSVGVGEGIPTGSHAHLHTPNPSQPLSFRGSGLGCFGALGPFRRGAK